MKKHWVQSLQLVSALVFLTRRRVRIGALVATALTLIGLWADLIPIQSCFAPTPMPTVMVATATATIPGVTPPTTPASFTYGITVKDQNNDPLIAKAQVRIEVEGKAPLTGYADSNGYTRLFVPTVLAAQPGRLTVEADGYAVEMQEIDLWPGRLPAEIRLKRQ
ncbi:MAG: hypothetical protein U0350_19305 [Caldilineaceae bacterium]